MYFTYIYVLVMYIAEHNRRETAIWLLKLLLETIVWHKNKIMEFAFKIVYFYVHLFQYNIFYCLGL